MLRLSLGVGFSDAQCGFKALSAQAASQLLPQVEDTEWFFDTELLARAECAGYRIHEFGTDWTDDPDSSVDVGIISTVLYAVLFLFAVQMVSPTAANIAALLISTVMNTALNRTHTFGVRVPHLRFVSQAKGLAAFGLCLAFTSAGLGLASGFTGQWASIATLAVLTAVNLAATVVRFFLMRTWVFARYTRAEATHTVESARPAQEGAQHV